MRNFRTLAALLAGVTLASCGEKHEVKDITGPTLGAAVNFFNFGVNAPAVNFYANNKKLTASSTTACNDGVTGNTTDPACLSTGKEPTTGTAYGQSANGNGVALYSTIAPGSYTLSGKITAATDNGLAISNTPANFENGKFYSYYLSGIYNTTTKTVEGFVVESPLPDFDYSKAYVRFVNAVSNSQPMTLYASLSGAETAIGADVAYKGAGTFVAIPAGTYDLNTRVAGSSTNVITRTAVSFSAGRVYTVASRGDITASTGTNKPALDNTPNR